MWFHTVQEKAFSGPSQQQEEGHAIVLVVWFSSQSNLTETKIHLHITPKACIKLIV